MFQAVVPYKSSLENQKLLEGIRNQKIQNRYLPQTLQQELLKINLANQLAQGKLPYQLEEAKYLAPQAQANVGLTNAQAGLAREHAGLFGQQTLGQKLANQLEYETMPYKVGAAEYLPEEAKNKAYYTKQQGLKEAAQAQQLSDMISYARSIWGDQPQEGFQQNPSVPQSQQTQVATQPTSGEQVQPQIAEGQPANFQSTVAPQRQNPLSMEQKMLRLADMTAMMKGTTPPSLEATLRGNEEIAKLNAKEYSDLSKKYAEDALSANTALGNLQELETAISKLPNSVTNTWMPEYVKKIIGGKDAQVALKAGANLMMGELRPMFSGLGQLRIPELNMLTSGNPNINMSKAAAMEVIGQVRAALEIKRIQGEMMQKLRAYTHDPYVLQSVLSMAAKHLNPIDAEGIHPERLKDWKKYATPDAIRAAERGEDFIPDNIDIRNLHNDAKDALLRQLAISQGGR